MSDAFDYPPVVLFAVPWFVIAMVAELLWIRAGGKGRYEMYDTVVSLSLGIGSVFFGLLFGGLVAVFYGWLWELTPLRAGASWGILALCFVLDDLRYYWVHRLGHRIRWMWAAHVNHHSSQHYNLSTALRQSWTSFIAGNVLIAAPLVLLGFHPSMVLFCGGINLLYQFWIHTESISRLPLWFEAIFNTPSHHRVHHSRNPRYLDANYAGVFIIWDRMFGTFVPELEEDPVDYGLVHNLGTFSLWRVVIHEWVAIFRDASQPGLSLRERLAYAFLPPGWSHDASRETTEMLKERYLKAHPEDRDTPGFS